MNESYLNAQVVLVRLLVWNKRLNNEMIQDARDNLNLAFLIHSFLDPLDNFWPSLVDCK